MASDSNPQLLLAQQGDKIGFALAGLAVIVFATMMAMGSSSGEISPSDFESRVNSIVDPLTAEPDEVETDFDFTNELRSLMPAEMSPFPTMPAESRMLDKPDIVTDFQFGGLAGSPASDLNASFLDDQPTLVDLTWNRSRGEGLHWYRMVVWTGEGSGPEIDDLREPTRIDGQTVLSRGVELGPVEDYRHFWLLASGITVDGNQARLRLTQVVPNQTYTIRIWSLREDGSAVIFPDTSLVETCVDSVTPPGTTKSLPRIDAINPTIVDAAIGGVRLAWDSVPVNAATVDEDSIRVLIYRSTSADPNPVLLTPATPSNPSGYSLGQLNGSWVDTDVSPEIDITYTIRLYHVEAFPNDAGDGSVSPAGDPLNEVYIGTPLDVPLGEWNGNRFSTPIGSRTVYASSEATFQADNGDTAVRLENRPVVELLNVYSWDDLSRNAQLGSATIRVSRYILATPPGGGAPRYVLMGAEFEIQQTRESPNAQVGGRAVPTSFGPGGSDTTAWDGYSQAHDFSTTLRVIGFFDFTYEAQNGEVWADAQYIELVDQSSNRWPYKVYLADSLTPEQEQYAGTIGNGYTTSQAVNAYRVYRAEEVAAMIAAERAAGAPFDRNNSAHVDTFNGIFYNLDQNAVDRPMWDFTNEYGIRHYTPWQLEDTNNVEASLNPPLPRPSSATTSVVDAQAYYRSNASQVNTFWATDIRSRWNETRRLENFARIQVLQQWLAIVESDGLDSRAAQTFVTAEGNDSVVAPWLWLQIATSSTDEDTVVAAYELLGTVLDDTFEESLPNAGSAEEIRDASSTIGGVMQRLYDLRIPLTIGAHTNWATNN